MKREILVFEIDGCRYGLSSADIRELVRVPTSVSLPKAPAVIEGIINLRGKVVPVLDIRKRFRHPAKAAQPQDHLVVAQADRRLVALRVDRAVGLSEVSSDDIENAAAITPRTEYLAGVAKLPDGLVLIHDLRTFLADSEARHLDEAFDSSTEAFP